MSDTEQQFAPVFPHCKFRKSNVHVLLTSDDRCDWYANDITLRLPPFGVYVASFTNGNLRMSSQPGNWTREQK